MEVCGVPEKDQEVVKLVVEEDYIKEQLGLTAPIDWLYVEERQSLVAQFEDVSVAEKFLSNFPRIRVDDNVTYQVCRCQQAMPKGAKIGAKSPQPQVPPARPPTGRPAPETEAVSCVEVLNVSDEFLVMCFFENLVGHSLQCKYDADRKLMIITFDKHTEAEDILLRTTYKVDGHVDVTVRKPQRVTRAIFVSGIPASATDAQLRMYFKGPRACGGAIESIAFVPGESHARIIFEDESVARAVVSKQEHIVRGALVSVRLAEEEPAGGDRAMPTSAAAAPLQAAPEANEAARVLEVLNVSDVFLVCCFFENIVEHSLLSTYDANRKLMMITFDNRAEAEKILLQATYQVEGHAEVAVRKPSRATPAIRVSGIPKSTSESQLKMYFKGPRACGGEIKSIIFSPGDSHAQIIFEDASVASAVASKQDHVFKEAHLSVTLAEDEVAVETALPDFADVAEAVLESNETANLIEVLEVTDTFLVTCFFENMVTHDLKHVYDCNSKTMVITFKSPAEAEMILSQDKYVVEGHNDVTVRRPRKTRQGVLVTDIPASIRESSLKAYFQGSQRGGGPIASIAYEQSRHQAKIFFEDERVVGSVVSRERHLLAGQAVTVRAIDEPALPLPAKLPLDSPSTPTRPIAAAGSAGREPTVVAETPPPPLSMERTPKSKPQPSVVDTCGPPEGDAAPGGSPSTSSAVIVRNLPIGMGTAQLWMQIVNSWGIGPKDFDMDLNSSSGAAVIHFTSAAGVQRALATELTKGTTVEVCPTEHPGAVLGDVDLLVDDISLETSREALWCWLKVVVGQFPHRIIYSTSYVKAVGQFAYFRDIDIERVSAIAGDSTIDGKSLHIKPVRRRANMLVTNIKDGITEAMLKKYLENAKIDGIEGSIGHIRLVESGSAVVSFSSQEVMKALLKQQRKHTLGGQELWLCQHYEELGAVGQEQLVDFSQSMKDITEMEGRTFSIDPQLIVKGFEGKVQHDLLKRFLENRKLSSGGKIKSFLPSAGFATATFEDAEAVDRVCQKYQAEGLSVGGCALTVSSKQTADLLRVAKNKVLLRNIGQASEDSIKYFLWGLTGTPVEQLSFVREPQDPSMCVEAVFSEDVDVGRVTSRVRALTLDDAKVDAEPMEEYSILTVMNVPVDAHRDVLELSFPGDLERCIQQSPGVWLITPSDRDSADRILREPVTYDGQVLSVSIHSPFQRVENAREPGKRGRLQAVLQSVLPAVVDFVLAKRKTALDALQEETGCVISRNKHGILTAVYSRPIPSAQYPTVLQKWRSVQQRLLTFFDEFLLEPVQVVPGIWDAVLKSDAYNNAVNSCANDLTVLWPEPDVTSASRTLQLIGTREAVRRAREQIECAVKDINDKMERERQVTQVTEASLTDWGIGLLKASGFFEVLPQRFNGVTCELDEGLRQIHLRGLPRDIQQCLTSLKDTVSSSAERSLEWSVAAAELVKKESVRQLIDGKLSTSGLAKSCVWWVGDDARVLIRGLTEETAHQAVMLINQQITENQVKLEPEAELLLESDKWKNEVSTMCAKRGGNAVVTQRRNPFMLLIACLESDANSLLEELRNFLLRHVMKKQFFRMSTVIMRLLTGSMKADVDKLEQSQSRNGVKLEARLDPKQMGFHIEGNTDGSINIRRMIKDLIKKEKVVTREHLLNVPGARTALAVSGGTVLLEVSRSTGTHIQMYDEDDVEEPEESAPDAAAGSTSNSSEGEVVTLPCGVQVCIAKADITELECDVIVNPSNQNLNHAGGLAKIIADKAGPGLNQECQAYVNSHGRLKDGEACITGVGNLRRCKRVVHAVGPTWQGGARNESSKLFMAVTQSLRLAAESGCSSIAVPPISSGIFGYPLDKCTKTIVDSVIDHCEEPDGSPLKRIVLVDINDNGVTHFRQALDRRLGKAPAADELEPNNGGSSREANDRFPDSSSFSRGPSHANIETPSTGFFHKLKQSIFPDSKAQMAMDTVQDGVLVVNGLRVELLKDNLFTLNVESLVCTVTSDLDLSKGLLSQLLSKQAGPGLQQQLKSENPASIKDGDIVAAAGHQMQHCKLVLLACCPHCQQSTQGKVIKNLTLGCLDRASKQNIKSIAFPAIGTGNLGFPSDEVASNMFDAFIEFSRQNRNPTTVKIVVARDDLMSTFDNALRRAASRSSTAAPAGGSAATQFSSSAARTGTISEPATIGSPAALTGREHCFSLLEEGGRTPAGTKKTFAGDAASASSAVKKAQFGNIMVKIIEGDITDETTDIIVNCTDENLSLNGQVARTLTRKGGSAIAEECRRKGNIKGEGLFLGTGGTLNCHNILHVDAHMPLSDIIKKSLKKAEEANAKSISFPAIGTGTNMKDPKAAAKDLFDAVANCTKDRKPGSLKVIQFVIHDTNMMTVFQQALHKVYAKITVQSSTSSLASMEPRESSVDLISDVEELLSDFDDPIDPSTAFATRLSITGPEAKLPLAIAMLADQCHSRLDTQIIKEPREMILALTPNQVQRLSRLAVHRGVLVELNKDDRCTQVALSSMDRLALGSMRAHVSELLLRGQTTLLQEEMVSGKWQWQYRPAGAGDWRNYPRSLNAMLERASLSKQPVFKYGPSESCYIVDFVKNVDSSEVVSGDVAEVRRWNVQSVLPLEWSQTDGYVEVLLAPSCKEYLDVTKAFLSTLADLKVTVIEVKRVQNPSLYQLYLTHKERVKAGLSPGCKLEVERKLWHGTAEDTMPSICRKGFNRSYCGKNATVYGQGVYFARDARYSSSNTYSVPNAANEKYMIYCLVQTGEFEVGNNAMRVTNSKPGQPMVQFDTTVDQIANPSIFVTYHDAQVYPAYTVKFKLG